MASNGNSLKSLFLKAILPLLIGTLGLVLILWALQSKNDPHESSQHPSPADFKLDDSLNEFKIFEVETRKSKKLSEFKQKILILNFWASWCGPCLQEIPSLLRLKKDFDSKGVHLLLMNVEDNPKETSRALKERFKIDFEMYFDENQSFSEIFGIQALPYTVILSEQRKVLSIEQGGQEWDSEKMKIKFTNWTK